AETLAVAQARMQHAETCRQALTYALDQLRRERDLGNQHQHGTAARQRALGTLQIDFGLTAAGDAPKHVGGIAVSVAVDQPDRGELCGRKYRCWHRGGCRVWLNETGTVCLDVPGLALDPALHAQLPRGRPPAWHLLIERLRAQTALGAGEQKQQCQLFRRPGA